MHVLVTSHCGLLENHVYASSVSFSGGYSVGTNLYWYASYWILLAVTDFSFVSSEVGIPFATNEGALTVTRCASAARYIYAFFLVTLSKLCLCEWNIHIHVVWVHVPTHSCSQCLQTDNVCGWCIYNKVCSGIPAPCTNETNWFQVSLWHGILCMNVHTCIYGHNGKFCSTHSWMGLTPPTWMCVLSWSPHPPHCLETMCNQWALLETLNYRQETFYLLWDLILC